MGRIGGGELLIILVIALLIFGPGKLAEMGKGLGEGLKNFKKGIAQGDGATDDDHRAATTTTVTVEAPKALPAAEPRSAAEPRAATAAAAGDGATSDRTDPAPPRT